MHSRTIIVESAGRNQDAMSATTYQYIQRDGLSHDEYGHRRKPILAGSMGTAGNILVP